MKKLTFLLMIFVLIVFSCSLNDSDEGTISISATDSASSITKDGISMELQTGVYDASLGYIDENGDTVWEALLDNPDTIKIMLRMNERCNIGEDTIKVKEYSHPFDFFRLQIAPPKVMMNDSIEISTDNSLDTLKLFFAFDSEIDLNNGHVNINIDFHSDKWCDFSNVTSINSDSMMSAITCSINN